MHSPAHIQKASDSGFSRVRKRPVIQADLEVGKPGDKYEQEADAVAQRVMMQPSMDEEEAVQMQPAEEEEAVQMETMDEEEAIQMEAAGEEEEMVQMEPAGEEEEMVQMAAVDEEEAVQMQAEEEESVQMEMAGEEEEMAQMQSAGEEEEMVAMESMAEEDESLQMASAEEEEGALQMEAEDEEEVIQQSPAPVLQRDGSGGRKASAGLASRINSAKGGGDSMESGIQREMEHKIGADFSGVNIHTGSSSVQMSRELGAKAFTVGNDIHFNRGQYDPHSSNGKRLLAHELTHTLQQGASARRKPVVRRENVGNADNGGEEKKRKFDLPDGTVVHRIPRGESEGERRVVVKGLSIPGLKARNKDKFPSKLDLRPHTRKESDTKQREIWKNALQSNVKGHVEDLKTEAEKKGGYDPDSQTLYFRVVKKKGRKQKGSFYVIGTIEEISEEGLNPFWSSEGEPATFHVDHIVEDQLVNPHDEKGSRYEADQKDNLELLEAGANMASGSNLYRHINKRLGEVVTQFEKKYPETAAEHPLNFHAVRKHYFVNFINYDFTLPPKAKKGDHWKLDDIEKGKHLKENLDPLTGEEVKELGDTSVFKVFTSPSGGTSIDWESRDDEWVPKNKGSLPWEMLDRLYVKKLVVNEDENAEDIGYLEVDAYKSGQEREGGEEKKGTDVSARYSGMTFYLKKIPGVYGGGIDKGRTLKAAMEGDEKNQGVFQSLSLPGLSPIEFKELDFDPNRGFVGRGKVLPTIPVIRDADIELIVDGAEFRLRKVFETEEINVPSPFSVSNSSLEVFFSSQKGLGVEGKTDFGIDRVGEGFIGAGASTSGGFELEGEFNFDSKLFDPAKIGVEYKDETWTIGGEIGIPAGKVTGIKKATIKASYSENTFKADGEAELDVPGIEKGTMNVIFGKEGFSIGGAFDLSSDIPGIRSGSVEATVSKKRGEEEYSVTATGKAKPEIPGVNAELSIGYDNGIITIGGTADYSRGMLSGSVRVGATNRPIGDDGKPEGEPDKTMRVYGGGSLTLQLTPWLEATAGVEFLENGEMEVKGKIGLPSTVDVFPRKEINKDIFRAPTLEIPLFAIPLGPRSIGLVAQIGGGLTFKSGFGPGQLRELYAEVTYNPDKEEETELSGRGVFAIPADAGLTLSADASLGVSAGIASLTGGIELAGTLGLKGEAAAEVDVNWSPQTGIALDAKGSVTVHPKFKFDVNAFARGSLGVGFLKVSKTWRHNLAGFEWGPDIQFGIVFPVHYREGEPFDLSFDDIEVIYPELDIPNMAKGLARDVKDDLF